MSSATVPRSISSQLQCHQRGYQGQYLVALWSVCPRNLGACLDQQSTLAGLSYWLALHCLCIREWWTGFCYHSHLPEGVSQSSWSWCQSAGGCWCVFPFPWTWLSPSVWAGLLWVADIINNKITKSWCGLIPSHSRKLWAAWLPEPETVATKIFWISLTSLHMNINDRKFDCLPYKIVYELCVTFRWRCFHSMHNT